MAEYRIRPVDGADDDVAETLRLLHYECFGYSAPQADYDVGQWWMVSDGREIAGFAGITPSEYGPGNGFLKRAGVRLCHRGHGLQRRLIDVRDRYARRVGYHTTYTDTAPFNYSSSNNLFDAGYRLFKPVVAWNGDEWLYWRKRYA